MCDAFLDGKNGWVGALGGDVGSRTAIAVQNQWLYENQYDIIKQRQDRDEAFRKQIDEKIKAEVAAGTYDPAKYPGSSDRRDRKDAREPDQGDESRIKTAGDPKKKIPPIVSPLAGNSGGVLGSVNLLGGRGA